MSTAAFGFEACGVSAEGRAKVSKQSFIHDLVDLLIRIDRGMLEFEAPLPIEAEEGIKVATAAFGEEALPLLHKVVGEQKAENTLTSLTDVLGMIGDPTSVPYLIELHSKFADYESGLAAVQALRKIGTEDAYLYLNRQLMQYLAGEKYVFDSGIEIAVTCKALGEWRDERAIPALQQANGIRNPNGMPRTAIEQLATYPQSHAFLNELADQNDELRDMIRDCLKKKIV